jgi:hypothetical protein
MEPGVSPGTAFISWVTVCVLTTSYRSRFVETSLRTHLSPRQPGSHEHGPYRHYAADKSCSSVVPGMPRGKTSPRAAFESSSSQTQQRWAERPVHRPALPPIIPPSDPALIPPAIPSHPSAHRYCAWNLPVFPSSTSSRCFPSEGVEAIEPIKVPAGGEVVESSTFRILNSSHAHRGKQGQHPVPRRDFSPGRAVLLERPGGRSVRNRVKTPEGDGLLRGGPKPGVVPSATSARLKASSTSAGRVFTQSLPPRADAAIYLLSISRPMGAGR